MENKQYQPHYNKVEELGNKADSKTTTIMNTTPQTTQTTLIFMNQERTSILNAMTKLQDDTCNDWAYILENSGKLYYETVTYTIEYDEDCEDEDSPMAVCSFNSTSQEMAPYLPTDVVVIDEKQMAAYMWANHEVLCIKYKYYNLTLVEKCGILDAIAMQLHYIRQLSPKYYTDNMGFSEPYKSLRNYTYARRRADEIYKKLQEEARTY